MLVLRLFPEKARPYIVLSAGFVIHLTLGSVYSLGNIAPYVASYLRFHTKQNDVDYSKMAWFTGLSILGQSTTLFLGGLLERKLGPRLAALAGCILTCAANAITYETIEVNFLATLFSNSLLFGLGVGFAYNPPIICSTKWFPKHRGFAVGTTVAGFGLGAFVFNQIQTQFVNPSNLKADRTIGDGKYFDQTELLDRVPKLFLLLAGITAGVQLVGLLFLENPDEAVTEHDTDIPNSRSDASLVADSSEDVGIAVVQSVPQKNPGIEDEDLTPLSMLKSPAFYILWLMFMSSGQGVVFVSVFYKAYGLTFIHNDLFLSVTGSVASIFNALGRILWGHIGDKMGFNAAYAVSSALLTVFVLCLIFAKFAGEAFYLICICGVFLSFSANFSLYAVACMKCFGTKHFGVNYGILFTSQCISGLIGATLSTSLLNVIGFDKMFLIIAAFTYSAFILNCCLIATKRGRKTDSLNVFCSGIQSRLES